MNKSKCSICGTEESKHWMMFNTWNLCDKCSKDYSDFKLQPENQNNIVILMEVYFRKGEGEEISYEHLHRKESSFKFLTFKDLYEEKK